MSSLEKRHKSRRGSMQGHHKYSDGFSDTSSMGSFMDETDREVSNLTDRAFRSLCIGEEAIYNDSEISSPTERHKAFAEEIQQKEVLKTTCQEALSYGFQYGEAERQSELTSTFQHSYMDVAQEQVLREEHMSYMSNGSIEATWQQRRSTSRVSSLIKAFSSREGYCDSGTPDALLLRDKYRDYNNGSLDKSALLNIQKELSEFTSTYHPNLKSGPFQSYRNHLHASTATMAGMDTTMSFMKSSKTKFQALNSTNFFFHSEFSPFQLWKDYNRFPFEREEPLGFLPASDFPRWYDSPLYKELTATESFSSESRRFNRRKIEDVVPTQRSRSTVVQKAPAIEKRCESEMASNCPPWKRNNNFVRSKLPSNRPSTVSPTNSKTHRPNSSLLSYSRHTYETQQRLESTMDNQVSNSSTPFNISQLLTPVIHGRQETETSEILQFAHTPSLPDYSIQGDDDLKSLPDVRQLRDSYKSKASSLLFNLKDNRKRVKSRYTPSKFTSLEITDRTKQPSMLDDLESRLSDTSVPQSNNLEHFMDSREADHEVQQSYEASVSQSVENQMYANGLHDDMTLASHYGAGNYKVSYGASQGTSIHSDTEYDFSPCLSFAQNKSAGYTEGQIYGLSKKASPTRPEIENNFPEATTLHPPAHSLSAQVSEKWTFGRRDVGHQDLTERQNMVRETNYGYTANITTETNLSWENREPSPSVIKDSLTFKGEIATLIERGKQRKATAKQYLLSANDSHTTEKESYINKVNEDIKQGRLIKEEEDQNTEGVSKKYLYTNKYARDNPTNGPSTSHPSLYEFQNNAHHKMTPSSLSSSSSPPKESSFIGQRNIKYATSNITTEKDNYQKIQPSISLEERRQKIEGSVAYQPYKYEPNKQWHIAANENRSTVGDANIPILQQQIEKKSEQSAKTHYAHPLLETSDNSHKNPTYATTRSPERNVFTEEGAKTGEHRLNESMTPKHGDMKANINKQHIQSTEPNSTIAQTKEDKFSINDILSIRDNEQAKRIRENKLNHFPASVGEPLKLDNQTFPVTSAIVEIKEQHPTQNPSFFYKQENADVSYGYIRRESHFQNEGLANYGAVMTDSSVKSGKETFPNKENDKIIQKSLFYKEKGQTKQEILTSKLKAQAQKEISAIKDKGLAKQGILLRNPVKQNTAVYNTKGQVNQEVLSPKKEITAEKLNHLFQDITYSSVTLYTDRNDQNYEPFTTEEITLPKRATESQAKVAVSEKINDIPTNEKERTYVQPLTEGMQSQNENITVTDKEISYSEVQNKFTTEQPVNERNKKESVPPAKHLTNSPAIKHLNQEASSKVVKTKEQATSNLLTKDSANPSTEYPTVAAKRKESPKNVGFGKITPYSATTYSNIEQYKSFDHSVNKKQEEQPSNGKVNKTTASSLSADQKYMAEISRPPVESPHHASLNSSAGKEMSKEESTQNMFEIHASKSKVKSPTDGKRLKDEALPVEPTLPRQQNSSDNKMDSSTNYKASSTKEGKLHTSGNGLINANETSDSTTKIQTPEAKDILELGTKQDIKVQVNNASKTFKNEKSIMKSVIQQPQLVDPVKLLESADKNKEKHLTPDSNKQENVSKNEDPVIQKNQKVEQPKVKPFANAGKNQGNHATSDLNKHEKIPKNDSFYSAKSFENEDINNRKHLASNSNKQDNKSKNEDPVIQKNPNVDPPKVKPIENTDKNKGKLQTSDLNKSENISKIEDSVILKNLHVDTPEVKPFKNTDKNMGKLQTSDSDRKDKPHSKKEETRDSKYPHNPRKKADKVTESNGHHFQQDSYRPSDHENHIQKEKDSSEQDKSLSKEVKQAKDKSPMDSNYSKPTNTENEYSPEKSNLVNVPINNADEQMNCQDKAQEKSSDIINPGAEIKEDSTLADEPVIYSICISSKSDVVSEDEPVIYTICVSSISDSSMTDGPVNQDTQFFSEKQLSTEGAGKEGETSGNKNEETKTTCLEIKASDGEKAKASFSSDKMEKEPVIKKYDSPATKDKQDYYRSSEVNNISSSYESLLAKYGLSIREKVHGKSQQKDTDKLQEKEKEESTNNLSKQLQKNLAKDNSSSSESVSADIAGQQCQESRKQKLPEVTSELLKKDEENKQNITCSIKKNEGFKQGAAGIINTKDKKQLERQNEQNISDKQTSLKSKVMKPCEDKQDTPTIASKQNTRNYLAELDGEKKVGQKVQNADFAGQLNIKQKENENDSLSNKKVNAVSVEKEKDCEKTGIRSTKVTGNQTGEDTHLYKPEVSMSVKDSKASETVDKEVHQYGFNSNRVPRKDTTHTYKLKPATPPVQHRKVINETIKTKGPKMEYKINTKNKYELDEVKPKILSKEQAPMKDNKALQNSKKELGVSNKELPEQEQAKFKTINETKDRQEIGITASSNKQTDRSVQENCSVSEDLHKNACPTIKEDQSLFKAPNILLEDPKVNKDPIKLNKDISKVQERMLDEQKQINTESIRARDVMLPKITNPQNVTSQEVAGHKTLSITSFTESGLEFRSQKSKEESAPRQKENVKHDEGNAKDNVKDNAKKAHVVKVEKGTEGESNKNNSLKEGTDQPQVEKRDTLAVDNVNGQTISRVGAVVVKESIHGIRQKIGNTGEGSQVRHDGHDRVNVYQYHPGKGFLPETKVKTYDEQCFNETNPCDRLSTKATSTKSEDVQREKKANRPDISALADYARLRVIPAVDENASEKDLLDKLDTYRKYNSSSVEPLKSLQGNQPIRFADTKRELTVNKRKENESQIAKPLQVHESERLSFQKSRSTEGNLEGQNQFSLGVGTVDHPKVSALAKSSEEKNVVVKETGSTKDKTITNKEASNTKISAPEQQYGYQRRHNTHQSPVPQAKQSLVSQVEGKNDDPNMIRQRVHSKLLEKDSYPHVQKKESQPQRSVVSPHTSHDVNNQACNKINALPVSSEIHNAEKGEELEYYTVSALESETKPKNMHTAFPFSDKEVTSKKEANEIETRPRSNASSPAMGKPTMFRVKDNTMRTSSVTKAVKPLFHRSFSEELKVSSSKEFWSGSEKAEHDHEYHPKESANPQVLLEPAVVLHRLPRAREIKNSTSSAEFTATKDAKSYHRRSQGFEDDDSRSVISTQSEDVESIGGSSVVMADSLASHEMTSTRSTYERPESSCYERPGSSCYERPESACSDIRSMGRPPVVPPKSEKALRRAQKLTTRRIKKAEAKITNDSKDQLETNKPVRAFSSLPSSPMELMSTNHTIQASPPISHYHVDPNYAAASPSLVAHPFPVTQRKLLQDPNSGQYFMVDMPVPHVKTKMFFDPETGKYVQLNVRQRTQSTLSQPQSVEVLNHSYVVYPGFLPMSVSTLPTLRSSSQMSAPAALVEEPNKLEASRESERQETHRPNCYNNNNAAYGSHEHSGCEEQSLYTENNVKLTPRHTGIITMSELEDFAMESI